jgi:hypothetical protein
MSQPDSRPTTPDGTEAQGPREEWNEKLAEQNGTEASPQTPDFGPAPEGGFRAWSVAFGAACISFATLGFINSFGVFQEYYMTHQLQDRSADDIAWIGSLSTFLQFAVGAIGGPLFDRYGSWVSSVLLTARELSID